MYINSIIWFLFWPVMIYLSYRIIYWAVQRFEKKVRE